MVLAIDIGNSNIVIGAYKDNARLFLTRMYTDTNKTADEYAVALRNIMHLHNFQRSTLSGAVISSVVPQLTSAMKEAVSILGKVPILMIGPGIKTGLNIKIDNPAQLGADLAATAMGAAAKYQLPAIIIDLGTATKITVLDENKNFLGGSIMPGVYVGLNALIKNTAQLPQIGLEDEVCVIGTNTVDCMKSGAILGAASMIDGIIERYKEVIPGVKTVVACGGIVNAVIPHCKTDIVIDESLLLDGLMDAYNRNIRQ